LDMEWSVERANNRKRKESTIEPAVLVLMK
jgi:hypothetical protein